MNTPFIVTKSHKSVGIAILLTFLFGSIGLLYASVAGGLIMTFIPIILGVLFFLGIFQENILVVGGSLVLLVISGLTFWIINIFWAVISVRKYNKRVDEEAKRNFEIWNSFNPKDQNQFVIDINQKATDEKSKDQTYIEVTSKSKIQDWLKANPSKTLNDYYSKFR